MFEARNIIHLSPKEAEWERAMQRVCKRLLRANTRLVSNDNLLAKISEEVLCDSRLALASPVFKFNTKMHLDRLPIAYCYLGNTESGLFVAINDYEEGEYWPHKHGAAWICFIDGGGEGFHSDGKQHEWFKIKAGEPFDHPEGVYHGYRIRKSRVLAIGASSAKDNIVYATEDIMRVFNQGPPGVR